MDLGQATGLAGATIIVGVLVQVLKSALAWGADKVSRYGPLVSVVVGVVVVVLLTAAQGTIDASNPWQSVASAIIVGILAGAASAGLYDGTKIVTSKVTSTGSG